jgi:hypothetical protein
VGGRSEHHVESAKLPVLGQLARVRGRHWVVTDVAPTTLPFDIKSSTVGEGQTLVTLSSVEDDGLGEELRVLWELEAGRRILDSATLPDLARGRFDDPATLGAFLDALRWGAVTNAETTVLQAPFRAGIAIEDYQLEPVTRALTMPGCSTSTPATATTPRWAPNAPASHRGASAAGRPRERPPTNPVGLVNRGRETRCSA